MNLENKLSVKGFAVWLVATLFFLYEFMLRTLLGSFQINLIADLNLTNIQFAILSSGVFCTAYGLMQLPVGFIIEHFRLKISLVIGCVICTMANFAFAQSEIYTYALFARLFTGLGASFGFICMLYVIYDWMPRRHYAFIIGISQFIGTMGPMFAGGPLEDLLTSTKIGWQQVFVYLGYIGMIITILTIAFVENNVQKQSGLLVLKRPEKQTKELKKYLLRWQPWFISIYSAASFCLLEYLTENDGKLFITLKGYDLHFASYMMTLAWIGYAIGCPLLGFVSDRIQRRKHVLVFAALSLLLSMLVIIYLDEKIYLIIAFFMLGIGASGQSIGFATIAEHFTGSYVAIGFGLNNTMISAFSVLTAIIISAVLQGQTGTIAGILEYKNTFLILAFIALVATILAAFFIKETHCKSKIDFTYLSK